jgi:hypothetical protein
MVPRRGKAMMGTTEPTGNLDSRASAEVLGLLAHRARLTLTALAIALGTAFMAGSFVFTATLTHGLDSLFAQAATGTDVIVQHTAPRGAGLGAGGGGSRPLPATIAAATVSGAAHQNVDGVDPAAISTFTGLGLRSGSLASLSAGGLLVSQSVADAHRWRRGQAVAITFGSYGVSRSRIGGIFANTGPLSPDLISNATLTADTGVAAMTTE